MQAQLVGNFTQHHGPHGQFAVNKEIALPLGNRIADAQDGVKALLDVLDEPARFLQALLQALVTFTFASRLQGASINVVHPQAWHHIGVECHAKLGRALAVQALASDQHIGNHHLALDIDKAPARLGLEPGNQCHGLLDPQIGIAHRQHQALDVTARQHVQRLLANGQRHIANGLRLFVLRIHHLELQAQAFGQVTRAYAGGLQAVQQMQGHLKAVFQLFELFFIVTRQGFCQRAQRVFQVAVVVQGLNQKSQGGAVGLAQAQRQGLAVQKVGQRLLAARQFGGIGDFFAAVVVARGRIAPPLAVVRRKVHAAIALPALGHAIQAGLGIAAAVVHGHLGDAVHRHLRRAVGHGVSGGIVVLGHGIGAVQAILFPLGGLVVFFQKRVVVEHLLDFLTEFQGGELQQPDRLLQLRRQGQML